MSPGSITESYPAFARIGLRGKPRKKPQPDNLPRPGFEPGPPGFAARRADRYSTVFNFQWELPTLAFPSTTSQCDVSDNSREKAESHALAGLKVIEIGPATSKQPPLSIPHPTAALTSIHASLPHFLPSPALASPVGSSSSQPGVGVSNAPCSTLFVANLGQFVSEHELKEIFSRFLVMGTFKGHDVCSPINDSHTLPQRVFNACQQIREQSGIFQRMRDSFSRRAEGCIAENGGHIEHLLMLRGHST
ncbi:hypothetical protein ANN_20253 [Periplaneta americana]|uniref:RRM domain-containing protein n=1 Tax=Periplaneta americana TaxID=6978 RepID=A0ABQ8SCA5_PERAM|nr:hypothetical protein ANN_20253 [Periplaneta americana]